MNAVEKTSEKIKSRVTKHEKMNGNLDLLRSGKNIDILHSWQPTK